MLTLVPTIASLGVTALVRYSITIVPLAEIAIAGIAGFVVYVPLLIVFGIVDIAEIKKYAWIVMKKNDAQ